MTNPHNNPIHIIDQDIIILIPPRDTEYYFIEAQTLHGGPDFDHEIAACLEVGDI